MLISSPLQELFEGLRWKDRRPHEVTIFCTASQPSRDVTAELGQSSGEDLALVVLVGVHGQQFSNPPSKRFDLSLQRLAAALHDSGHDRGPVSHGLIGSMLDSTEVKAWVES